MHMMIRQALGSERLQKRFGCWAAWSLLIAFVLVANNAGAEIPQPPIPEGADGDDLFSVIVFHFKQVAEAAMIILLVVAFVIAAYAGIVALYRLVTGRDDWGGLLGIFFGSLIVLAFVGFVLYEGDQTLQTVIG